MNFRKYQLIALGLFIVGLFLYKFMPFAAHYRIFIVWSAFFASIVFGLLAKFYPKE